MRESARTDSSASRIPMAMAVALGVAVGVLATLVAVHRGGTRDGAPATATSDDLAAYLPTSTRAFLFADMTRLRAAPALRAFFAADPRDDRCESQLLRRVDRVLLVSLGSFESVALAFQGQLPRGELLACARARHNDSDDVVTTRENGAETIRITPHVPSDLVLARDGAEIVYVPAGPVLVGAPGAIGTMIDHARAGRSAPHEPRALGNLARSIDGDPAIRAALLVAPSDVPTELDPALRHVTGIALAANVDSDIAIEVMLACDDYDSPRAVADVLIQLQRTLGESGVFRTFDATIRAATIERRATEVRVRARVSSELLTAVRSVLESVQGPPVAPESGPRDP